MGPQLGHVLLGFRMHVFACFKGQFDVRLVFVFFSVNCCQLLSQYLERLFSETTHHVSCGTLSFTHLFCETMSF